MVVEDQALIGMALEMSLQEAGFSTFGPFARQADALAFLETSRPDIALLDVVLQDGPCIALARALRQRGTPFAIYSGIRLPADLPAEFAGAPWMEKPASRDNLITILTELAQEQRSATAQWPRRSS
jgi:DNA-binding response OmpR family regulator